MSRNVGILTALMLTGLIAGASAQGPTKKIHGNGSPARSHWDQVPGVDPRNDGPKRGIVASVKQDGRTRDEIPAIDPFDEVSANGKAVCFGDGTGTPCPSGNRGALGHGCENSAGMGGALLAADGVAKLSADTMTLHVASLPNPSMAVFLEGKALVNGGSGRPFGDGILCVTGDVSRFAVKQTSNGFAKYPELRDMPLCDVGTVPPRGGSRYYQVVYRDVPVIGTRTTFNLSNGWLVPWVP